MGTWGFRWSPVTSLLAFYLWAPDSSASSTFLYSSSLWVQIYILLTSTSGWCLQELCLPLNTYTWPLLLQDQAALVSKSLSEITQTQLDFRLQVLACSMQSADLWSEQALGVTTLYQLLLKECLKLQCWKGAQTNLSQFSLPYLSGRNAISLNISDVFCRVVLHTSLLSLDMADHLLQRYLLKLVWMTCMCPYDWISKNSVEHVNLQNIRFYVSVPILKYSAYLCHHLSFPFCKCINC